MILRDKTPIIRVLLSVFTSLLVWLSPAHADIPTFKSKTFFCSDFPVWIPSGTLTDTIGSGFFLAEATITFRLAVSSKGRVTGRGSYYEEGVFQADRSRTYLDLPDFKVRGRVETIDGVTRIKVRGDADGETGSLFPIGRSVTSVKDVRVSLRGRIKSNGLILGTLRVDHTIKSGVGPKNPVTFDLASQSGNDGSWLLTMRLRSPDQKELKGWGAIEFTNNRNLDLVVKKGEYDRATDRSRIVLKREGTSGSDAPFVKLRRVQADADTSTITRARVRYRLFGWEGLARVAPGICP